MKKIQLLILGILTISITQLTSQVTCLLPPPSAPSPVPLGTGIRCVNYGLFDGDSYIDLLTAKYGGNTITLLTGSALGVYSVAGSFTVSSNLNASPNAIAVGHFDNNATLDVAVLNSITNDVAILFGTGTGSFSAATNYTVGNAPWDIARGDFNMDGNMDLAVCNVNDNSMQVLFGSPSGIFNPSGTYPTGSLPYGIKSADLNHDSNLDLVTVNYASNDISVFLGTATGNFLPATNFTVTPQPEMDLAISDLNGDTHPDIVISHNSTNKISVHLGIGDGTFPTSVGYNTGPGPRGVSIADFNNDSFMDLCVAIGSSNNISIFHGDGTGAFSTSYDFLTNGSGPWGVLVNDFNTDSKPDVAIALTGGAGEMSILLNSAPPTITAMSTSTGVCTGSSVTLSGSGADYYNWSNGVFDSNPFNPTTTQTYTVTGTLSAGCYNTTTITVAVSNVPTVAAISPSTLICSGAGTQLSASGANTYTWSTGEFAATITVTPGSNTTYTLTGDVNGCSNTSTINISVNPPKNLLGNITCLAGPVSGSVEIYKYTPTLSLWALVSTTPFTSTYSYSALDSGNYVIKAVPTGTNVQSTYAPSSMSWQGAQVISHGCTNNTNQNIDVIPFISVGTGTGFLSGRITEALGFGSKNNGTMAPLSPGGPIGGIIVKGGKNPGGMFFQTTTDLNGDYMIPSLPNNTGIDHFFVFVDIPGLDTNQTYHRVLTTGSNQYAGLDFTVDSIYINPIPWLVTSVSNNITSGDQIKLFPNPASDQVTIQYDLKSSSLVKIELFDMLGRSVKMLMPEAKQNADMHQQSWPINDLRLGLYFIKMTINGSESTIKLSVTN